MLLDLEIIFLKKYKAIKIDEKELNNDLIKDLKIYQNIILDNFRNVADERLLYSLFNLVDQDNKYLIINSNAPLNMVDFNLKDLSYRAKNWLFAEIEKPDDELIFALILKSFSDRQITVEKKLIDYIIKRIDRSYSKISEFIYKVDELSLKKKKATHQSTPNRRSGVDLNNCLLFAQFNYSEKIYIHITKQQLC